MSHHTHEERTEMLRQMHNISDWFYRHSQKAGVHAFLEFTGLMNEYITLCESAHRKGIDFTDTNIHGGGTALPMEAYHRAYLNEKLGCIYGTSLAKLMKLEHERATMDLPNVEEFEVGELKGRLALRLEPMSVGVTMVVQGDKRWSATIGVDELSGDGIWWLARCVVHEDLRGKGLGSYLVKRVQQLLRDRDGFQFLVVEPGGYYADPERQRAFYVRQGFVRAEDGAYIWPGDTIGP